MSWEIHAHEKVVGELNALSGEDRARADAALGDLLGYVDATDGAVRPAAPDLGPDVPRPDLKPLSGASVRGSYRLRVGDLRLALAILPDESMVLLTALRRRSETTYPELVRVHDRRPADR